MTVMTDEDVEQFITRNAWSTGLKLHDTGEKKLYFDDLEADAIFIPEPDHPRRVGYYARVLSILGGDDSDFYGAMLWITLSGIGSPQIEQTGFAMIDAMRRGSGDNRPLEGAGGNWFRSGAHVELASFLIPCMVFWWDAWIIPSGGDFFIYISHDQFIAVVTRNALAYKKCWDALQHCNPSPVPATQLSMFCPGSSRLAASQS